MSLLTYLLTFSTAFSTTATVAICHAWQAALILGLLTHKQQQIVTSLFSAEAIDIFTAYARRQTYNSYYTQPGSTEQSYRSMYTAAFISTGPWKYGHQLTDSLQYICLVLQMPMSRYRIVGCAKIEDKYLSEYNLVTYFHENAFLC